MSGAAERPNIPFVIALVAGLLILLGSGTMGLFYTNGPYSGGGPFYGGMMGGYYGMMQGYGFGGQFYLLAAIGIISGVAVLVGAVMLYTQPAKTQAWGAVVLAFSVASLIGMGGFFIGAILGIVGGVLALIWKPART